MLSKLKVKLDNETVVVEDFKAPLNTGETEGPTREQSQRQLCQGTLSAVASSDSIRLFLKYIRNVSKDSSCVRP